MSCCDTYAVNILTHSQRISSRWSKRQRGKHWNFWCITQRETTAGRFTSLLMERGEEREGTHGPMKLLHLTSSASFFLVTLHVMHVTGDTLVNNLLFYLLVFCLVLVVASGSATCTASPHDRSHPNNNTTPIQHQKPWRKGPVLKSVCPGIIHICRNF